MQTLHLYWTDYILIYTHFIIQWAHLTCRRFATIFLIPALSKGEGDK
ncbi:hypothetical protein [Nonlabens spongiae]|nr:hypothetical protein [Nonlabens spongiae]